MTVREAVFALEKGLSAVTDEARAEARLAAAHYLGLDRLGFSELDREAGEELAAALGAVLERRLAREPLAYVLGEAWFMGLRFSVGPQALIPRQDTETLCEEALRLIRGRGYRSLLDVCTGTGCIAVSLAKLSGIKAEASDISPACLELARKNAADNGVSVAVRQADLFEGAGKYDIITANPPYISDADMLSLQEEVKKEPELALRGGADGLDIYRRIAEEYRGRLDPGGVLLLEVGAGEARAVSELFGSANVRILKDLNGVERVVAVDQT